VLSNPIRCAALGAVLSLVGLASADGTLTGVSVDKSGQGVSVHISGKDLTQPTKSWAKNGNSLVLEFAGDMQGKPALTEVHKGGINSIYVQKRTGQEKVRVYIALDAHKDPFITKSEDGWDISFSQPLVKTVAKPAPTNVIEPSVPPLEPASTVLAKLHSNDSVNNAGPRVDDNTPRVSLDFVNTEILQILKALALQTGVNIVTAPDVKGTLTVDLADVTVKDALDMVTSVSGYAYTKVGNSYIVAPPEKINLANAALGGARAMMTETHIVPLYSGSGREIRATIYSSITDVSTLSNIHIYLPNEEFAIEKAMNVGALPTKDDKSALDIKSQDTKNAQGAASDSNAGTDKEQVSVQGMKEQYLVLVGPADKIDEVEDRIRSIDKEISHAYGFDTGGDSKLIRRTYMLRSDDVKASDLVKAVAATQPNNFLNVDMYATPGSFKTQSVVMVGREAEVAKAEGLLKDLDQSGYGDDVLMYDVKYADPRSLREALVAEVKGLRVAIPPASSGNMRVYEEGKGVVQANQSVSAGAADDKNAAAGASSDMSIHREDDFKYGLASPYRDFEKTTVPMRLVLTGTPEEIDSAKAYLSKVDVAAKQVALELRVMEMTKEQAEKIGLDWSVFTGSGAVATLRSITGLGADSGSHNPDGTYGVNMSGHHWSGSVTAQLDAISNRNNLIARPNMLALDGRESEIFVGDIIRYVQSIQSTQNGVTVTTAEVPVGVRLAVIPRIGDDSMTLDLRPMVSALKSFTDIPGGGQLPQTTLRTAQETVSIHDGDTIAIGGLIQDSDHFDETKVPLLGDLPIIGHLFRKTNKDKVRTEVVMFLTAKIVNDNAGNAADPRVSAAKYPAEIKTPVKP